MAKAHTTWKVLPHDPIQHLAANLWRVEGDLEGPPVRRTMYVIRLSDGRLVIHNGIALEEPEMKAIEAFGTPAFLVVPNGWHRLDSRNYKERYPAIRVVCPEGARENVEQVVPVDAVFGAFDVGSPDVVFRYLPGVKHGEGVVEVVSEDGRSLIFNDLVNNLPKLPGFQGFVYRLMAGTGKPRLHRAVAAMLVKDAAAFKAELLRLADLPDLRRLLVAHGSPIGDGAGDVLRDIASSL